LDELRIGDFTSIQMTEEERKLDEYLKANNIKI